MTIVRLKWADTAATDLHLITGHSSPELVRLLRVDDLTGETLTPDQPLPAGATVTFTPWLRAGDDHGKPPVSHVSRSIAHLDRSARR
ncbi:hypothetical protein DMA12_16515 [Amycolatopsis balhimycina DSM 5908]|uniref:Uncharacterized protein n=1 Tax=Amycolatopsis balhimycina DSM 5908 TaxID=1081091 RepID=A0A428WN34_AMYBA|nr:hypothetical protein [Amycolatopsis balhimycina]RSM44430.1 hypothetical protein DMA12_16515 [Amycolatopsis balhimycina DSM 5908]